MGIKRILCVFAFGLVATVASAAPPAGKPGTPALDPSTLKEEQIASMQVPQALYRLGGFYKQSGDYKRLSWTLRQLLTLVPNSGDVQLALATAYALQGEKSKAYDTLLAMQKQGYGYDLADDPNFAKIADTKVWTYINDGLKANLKPFGEGKVAFTLPKGDFLFESLAWDPKRKQLLVGSVRDGKISLVGKDGKLQDFIVPDARNGLWSVYAMAAVPADDALYVASTASVYFKGFTQADYGKAGVFKFSLSSGKLIDKYVLPSDGQPHTLSSIAAGRNGLVFAADGLRNVIYRLDGGTLKPTIANPKLVSLRGLALSGNGGMLYFADYTMGVFGVDLAGGKAFDLQYDPTQLALGGVDGLYWYDNTLVAIENGMSPRRVMRLSLSPDGRRVTKAMPLDASNPEFKMPTYGTVADHDLYFVANSQKAAYGEYGTPKDDAKLQAVNVFRSNLRFAWDEAGAVSAPEAAPVISRSTAGNGRFSNVQGGSQSVTGN